MQKGEMRRGPLLFSTSYQRRSVDMPPPPLPKMTPMRLRFSSVTVRPPSRSASSDATQPNWTLRSMCFSGLASRTVSGWKSLTSAWTLTLNGVGSKWVM